ncbi:hypothetical protein GCM10020219_060130 [Nonomuraea dietziae]
MSRVTALLAATALAVLSSAAPAVGTTARSDVRINQIQTIATHNSYHREVTDAEKDVQRKTDANWWNLQYSHAALPHQFASQRVRGIELDVFPDPQGGLYSKPLVRRDAGLPPLDDPDLTKPGSRCCTGATTTTPPPVRPWSRACARCATGRTPTRGTSRSRSSPS